MNKTLCKKDRPDWTDNVLQGLAYWIGYKKQYYRFYPLSEGAIVGEALSLLASNLDNNMRLEAEVMYKKICDNWQGQGRADIVISFKNGKEFNHKDDTCCVIEVKKYDNNPLALIEDDLQRMAECLQKSSISDLRCFLLLVSQDYLPKEYVTEIGNARKKTFSIEDYPKYFTKVRRVCKAVAKFDKKDKENNIIVTAAKNAYYACLLEVIKESDI